MINTKKLIKMAKKWQKVAALKRKRILLPKTNPTVDMSCSGSSSSSSVTSTSSPVADKGNFVVYTADQTRFELPIKYLNSYIFRELFRLSEEEFGLPNDGPITLPCDAVFMDYLVSLFQRRACKEMEKALVISMANTSRCSLSCSSLHDQRQNNQQVLLCSF